MKFTPESLLRIYLDGSFTEEAQAEFDALMRKDPAFSEKVTQAIAERLGPVPEATLGSIASKLDARRNDLWTQHKPSPVLRSLKLAGKLVLGVGAAALLWVSGRHAVEKFRPSTVPAGETSLAQAPQSSTRAQSPDASLEAGPLGTPSTSPALAAKPKKSSSAHAVPARSKAALSMTTSGPGSSPSVGHPGVLSKALPPPSKANAPGNASGVSAAEGDALRVAINTAKATQAVVTVFDSTGSLVRHLYQGPVDAGEHYLDWDGKDDQGRVVPSGDYNVVLDLDGKKMSGVLKVLSK